MVGFFKKLFGIRDPEPKPEPAPPSAPEPAAEPASEPEPAAEPAPELAPEPKEEEPVPVAQGGSTKYLIVGAGPSGVVAAETLRKADAEGDIVLIGNEGEPPYSRMAIPYYLIGNIEEQGTYLRKTDGHYDSLGIQYMTGEVAAVDPAGRSVTLADGAAWQYDKLLLATGASPIRPPIEGLDKPGVHHCWTLADARKIVELAGEGRQVVLLGAGFIGCIILESLFERGVNLTVVEMGDRMVPRMMDEQAGGLIKRWCEDKGVTVHTSTRVTKIDDGEAGGEDELAITLDNGETIPAHLLVVAAGVRSNTGFLDGSGIEVDEGILVDDTLKSSVDHVYAAGDCAQGPDFSTGGYSVHAVQPTAADHGRIAALNMAGQEAHYKGSLVMNVLDTAGLISCSFGSWAGVDGGESTTLLDEAAFRYTRLEFEGDVLVGAQCVGRTDHIGALRGLIQNEVHLGAWKEKLQHDPNKIMDAYVGTSQV